MSIISEKFSTKISTLKTEFDGNKEVAHQGVKGGLNESELSDLIREVIPKRYKLTKGVIENSKGEQSNETDILIYDDEILPSYMKNELAFVPVESVKYNFEVKSFLNASELKTTLAKFERYRSVGGNSPTVLFSFSSDIDGSEIKRLKKYDKNFFTNPVITVLCTSNKSYYYKSVSDHYLKDFLSNSEFLKLFQEASDLDLDGAIGAMREMMSNDQVLSQMSRSQFALCIQSMIRMNDQSSDIDGKEITVNGQKYSDITFKIHKWVGVEVESNEVELSFLSGISNTLSKGNFGQYLLHSAVKDPQVFAICFEDMWGNLSSQDFDENGLRYDCERFSYSFETSQESSKLIFNVTADS
ncbi:DUF6602 domain-containing protein [Idiomarina loihiensis]|uniref:DUF6602 domain-containing protein n=1 Tax=Idiomarina loihiensis TaxID=135577 RepID=UPI0039BE4F48